MKRRGFLRLAALAAAGLPACSSLDVPPRKTKNVIVLGAGLAGLVAGYELARSGQEVTILEARGRPGGRVETLRGPFTDDLHAEAGALFVPSSHHLTLRYVELFGLELQPALPPFEARLVYVRGKRVVASRTAQWPFDLRPDERSIGFAGMWDKYVTKAAAGLAAEELDRLSVAQFLRSQGASAEAIAMLRVGFLDMMGDGIESYSALQMRERLAMSPAILTIRGGGDLLPKSFAAKLEGRIRYGSPVIRIQPGAASVQLFTPRERFTADYVICTLPFSVLRQVETSPPFSTEKTRAIRELPYTSVVRVFLQFRRKAWTAEHLFFLTTTDLPVKWVFEHTINQPGPRGILEAQAFGDEARRLSRMPEAERIEFALSHVERVFPGIRDDFELGHSKSWDEDPWSRGAFAYFPPGQVLTLRPHLARPEGRVHFAGDHTSRWSGWMQGALESGLRAAQEVSRAA